MLLIASRRRGQTFRQVVKALGKRFESDWVVTEIEPGRRLGIEGDENPRPGRLSAQPLTLVQQRQAHWSRPIREADISRRS